MTKQAAIIAFCGIDGSGKTSQLNLVRDSLQTGYSVHSSKLAYFPLNNMGASYLKDHLLKIRSGLEIAKHYWSLQNDESKNNDFILCDRHLMCYLSYAMAYGVSHIDFIRDIFFFIKEPDLTLYFDVDVDEAMLRINERNKDIDKSENYETLAKAKEGYNYLIEKMNFAKTIDANGTIEETTEQVKDVIEKQFKITLPK